MRSRAVARGHSAKRHLRGALRRTSPTVHCAVVAQAGTRHRAQIQRDRPRPCRSHRKCPVGSRRSGRTSSPDVARLRSTRLVSCSSAIAPRCPARVLRCSQREPLERRPAHCNRVRRRRPDSGQRVLAGVRPGRGLRQRGSSHRVLGSSGRPPVPCGSARRRCRSGARCRALQLRPQRCSSPLSFARG